jgi:hypothetical protein
MKSFEEVKEKAKKEKKVKSIEAVEPSEISPEKLQLLLAGPAEATLPTVVINGNRAVLTEGRQYQLGFGFCKKLEDGTFETVQPLSCCKDYLNDVVYSEHTGRPFTVYGLSTIKHGIFSDVAYLAIKILPQKSGGAYRPGSPYSCTHDMMVDIKNLKNNYLKIECGINNVEKALNIEGPYTTITPSKNDPDLFLITLSAWWVRSTHCISLYSLLIRMLQFWNGEGDSINWLRSYTNPLDNHMWVNEGALGKFECALKYGIHITTPQELYDRKPLSPHVHTNGILAYN